LLERTPKDYDYVVTGVLPSVMERFGFTQVGQDFPVFLDSRGDEYALARTERKTGTGHNGFTVAYQPTVTLEEDLLRRDLTINAMAREVLGYDDDHTPILSEELIDPYGGYNDLRNHVTLRPVSEHFAEDPLRVLRAARMSARYHTSKTPSRAIHPKLVELSHDLCDKGEMRTLVAERVWSEVERALSEQTPSKFFSFLRMVGADCEVFNLNFSQAIRLHSSAMDSIERSLPMHRLVTLFSQLSSLEATNMLEHVKAPSAYIKFCHHVRRVEEYIQNEWPELHDPEDGDILEVDYELWINMFRSIGKNSDYEPYITYFCDVTEKLHKVAFERTLEIYRTTNLSSLSEHMQKTLKGPAIGMMIEQEALDSISRYLEEEWYYEYGGGND
jgi:tRNA nucleotidyltransferase (CCA-adding enzyme)